MDVGDLHPMAVSTGSDPGHRVSALLSAIPSSTAGKSNAMVLAELVALAALIASVGMFVAFAI